MAKLRRDAGLVRVAGPVGLAASVVGMMVGAGIYAVPADLAAAVGPYAPLAMLACAVAVGAIAVCFAEAASRIPGSAGAPLGLGGPGAAATIGIGSMLLAIALASREEVVGLLGMTAAIAIVYRPVARRWRQQRTEPCSPGRTPARGTADALRAAGPSSRQAPLLAPAAA